MYVNAIEHTDAMVVQRRNARGLVGCASRAAKRVMCAHRKVSSLALALAHTCTHRVHTHTRTHIHTHLRTLGLNKGRSLRALPRAQLSPSPPLRLPFLLSLSLSLCLSLSFYLSIYLFLFLSLFLARALTALPPYPACTGGSAPTPSCSRALLVRFLGTFFRAFSAEPALSRPVRGSFGSLGTPLPAIRASILLRRGEHRRGVARDNAGTALISVFIPEGGR